MLILVGLALITFVIVIAFYVKSKREANAKKTVKKSVRNFEVQGGTFTH